MRQSQPLANGAQRWLAAVIAVAVAVQFLLAGLGAFGATSFRAHTGLGWGIALTSLLALLLAVFGHSRVRASAWLFAAVVVQVAMGVLGEQSSAWFGALHGLNALAVAAAAFNLARLTAGADRGLGPSVPSHAPPDTSPTR